MRKLTVILLTLCLLAQLAPAFAENADAFTSASVNDFYADSAITKEALLEGLALGAQKPGSVTVATVNPDGSPNLAVVVPGVADENTLVFALAPNQTRENFASAKTAVMAYYVYNPTAEDKLDRNRGCRVYLRLVEDEERLAKLNEGKENIKNYQYFDIVDVKPLG